MNQVIMVNFCNYLNLSSKAAISMHIIAKLLTLWMNLYDTLSEILHVQLSFLMYFCISMQVLSIVSTNCAVFTESLKTKITSFVS